MMILTHPDEAFGKSLLGKILSWQSAWKDFTSAKLMFGFWWHLFLAALWPSVVLVEVPSCQPGPKCPVAPRAPGAGGASPGDAFPHAI